MSLNIDQLKRCSQRLFALMDDPLPGLMSWNMSLGEILAEVVWGWLCNRELRDEEKDLILRVLSSPTGIEDVRDALDTAADWYEGTRTDIPARLRALRGPK